MHVLFNRAEATRSGLFNLMPAHAIRFLKQLVSTLKGPVSGWAATGLLIALTGFAPQVWIARFFHYVAEPAKVHALVSLVLDLRVFIVLAGIAIVVGTVFYR